MPKYECSRMVEAVIEVIEAENDIDLMRKLSQRFPTADELVEGADVVVNAADWKVTEIKPVRERGILTFTDAEIAAAVESTPEPWVDG